MVEKGDGRRRDAPTPEEIHEECKRIRKSWRSGERVVRRARSRKQRWRLPEINLDQGDEEALTDDGE